ncbi:MAG: DUF1573 domain-containing protein [Candidatus Uhrbacteria bacterium]|nr:DUF1573 domain-containing protein [Candidatus Uhrbacteria bacterium]
MKNILIVIIVAAAIVGIYLISTGDDKGDTQAFSEGEIVFDESEYDFGVIKQSGGIVSHDFTFTYNGVGSLNVLSLPTSCSCTSAEIDLNVLEPGDTGVLTVSFDPNLHEEPEGKFYRSVYLITDPELKDPAEIKIWQEIDLDLGSERYKNIGDEEDEDEKVGYQTISSDELRDMLENDDIFLVDVHIPEQDHIDGTDAVIPFNEIEDRFDELPSKDAAIVLYCRSGNMSKVAADELVEHGYTNVYNLYGGIEAYNK